MVARRCNEEGIDFEATDTVLAGVALPKLTWKDLLDGWGPSVWSGRPGALRRRTCRKGRRHTANGSTHAT